MGKNSAPSVPDYTAAANQQSTASQGIINAQTQANRPNVSTPWGNMSWTNNGNGQWSGNESLNPAEQQSLSAQQNIQAGNSGIASNLMNTVGNQIGSGAAPNAAPNPNQMTGAGAGVNYDPTSNIQSTENAVWDNFKNMQMPLEGQQTEQEQSQLEAQGLRPGDAAYDNATKNLQNTQFTQNQTGQDQALLAGQQEASTLNQEQLAAQQTGFGQNSAQTQYNNALIPQNISNQQAELGLGTQQDTYGLNLMDNLLNGEGVSNPSFPTATSAGAAQAPNLLNAALGTGASNLDIYNAQTGNSNASMAGMGSLMNGFGNMGGMSGMSSMFGNMFGGLGGMFGAGAGGGALAGSAGGLGAGGGADLAAGAALAA